MFVLAEPMSWGACFSCWPPPLLLLRYIRTYCLPMLSRSWCSRGNVNYLAHLYHVMMCCTACHIIPIVHTALYVPLPLPPTRVPFPSAPEDSFKKLSVLSLSKILLLCCFYLRNFVQQCAAAISTRRVSRSIGHEGQRLHEGYKSPFCVLRRLSGRYSLAST